ncbi:BaiN/RdsA family NAD(P)/FAD-dependent oxidoreductase [Phenylobacterium soli]|uniref:Aminoacetone oxidase family FAD-binding enzyme n=1 Tax=Phenylobacterium soli TaxID=2170551 RepID=A0A328AGW7_9CAUL|nr:NAD(P)/FAD-dependent oxidoreductase [Phenylobacterium soli]RAK53801.1 aminoacetone oxidase family FAD-binding enzyme [Phenylobacterium soli]
MERFDVVIVGAGAAGMMCAIEAGKRGRRVLVLDHAKAAGEKIRISGGGRCNFTNLEGGRIERYLSANPRFALSALRRYPPSAFVALVERHGIAFHEKTLGQLFCDGSSREIVDMLLAEMKAAGVVLRLGASVDRVEKLADGFELALEGRGGGGERIACASLVLATGGKSIPKMGATGFAYDVARQFGLALTETRPALVPLTFDVSLLEQTKALSGVAVDVVVKCGRQTFAEAMLFTHRGLSGPAILQISSYWREGEAIEVDMAPGVDVFEGLKAAKTSHGKQAVATVLSRWLPQRLAHHLAEAEGAGGRIADQPDKALRRVADAVNRWRVKPVGSEGYRTAEVTLGGISTEALDGRSLEAKAVPGLYVVGEAVDVTGWLGGYNFQWAWASGWSAGQVC